MTFKSLYQVYQNQYISIDIKFKIINNQIIREDHSLDLEKPVRWVDEITSIYRYEGEYIHRNKWCKW